MVIRITMIQPAGPLAGSSADATPDSSRSRRHPLSGRLDDEWAAIRRRPRVVASVRSWGLTDVTFGDLDEFLMLAGYRTPPTPGANALLARLVEVAQREQLASRIVLQRLMPGLMAIVRRRRSVDGDGAFEELVGAAWLAIRTYRGDRSGQRVAANLVRDANYRAFTAPQRRQSATTEISTDPHALDETPATVRLSAGEELAELLTEARAAGVDGRDLDLLRELMMAGSPALVASARHVSTRTVRNHRDRAAARLRQVALAA